MRIASKIHFHPLPGFRIFVASIFLCLSAHGTSSADLTNANNARSQRDFAIAHVALGIRFEEVLTVYPNAQPERAAPNCHRFGQPIWLPERTPRVVRHNIRSENLALHFDAPAEGGKLNRIEYDRPVDPTTFNIRTFIDRLKSRYGPYDWQLLRRKMEPAGRVIGFEWRQLGRATLRVELREDHSEDDNYFRLKSLAWSTVERQRHDAMKKQSPCSIP